MPAPTHAPTFAVFAPDRTLHLARGGCLRFGRHATNEVVLDHPSVSRFHARLTWAEASRRPVLEDLSSANGTTLDGLPVTGSIQLGERATIELGEVMLSVRLDHPALIADDLPLTCRLFSDARRCEEAGVLTAARTVKDLLLHLERQATTGTLLLERGAVRARLTLAAGRIIDAIVADQTRPLTVELLAPFDGARYAFCADIEPCEGSRPVSPRELFGRPPRAARPDDEPTQRLRLREEPAACAPSQAGARRATASDAQVR